MAIESQSGIRNETDQKKRNNLQITLLELLIKDGDIQETDIEAMKNVFRQVSDIIDVRSEEHQSIIDAFESGDYHGAAQMLRAVITI